MSESKCPRCESPAPNLHPAMQADGGEVQPCTHPFHTPPNGGANTEEPAWKAELWTTLREAHYGFRDLLGFIEPHIKAAEERGRREALREAAAKIRPMGTTWEGMSAYAAATVGAFRAAADLIDPGKP